MKELEMFKVAMKFLTSNGKLHSWSGDVAVVPGENIFATARRVCQNRAKKGKITRTVRARAVRVVA